MNEDMKLVEKHSEMFVEMMREKYYGASPNEKIIRNIVVDANAFTAWVSETLSVEHVAEIKSGNEVVNANPLIEKTIIQIVVKPKVGGDVIAFVRIETGQTMFSPTLFDEVIKKRTQVPTINDAKTLTEKYGQDGVIIFFFKGDQYGFSSYGKDKSQCKRFGHFGNQIADRIESEDIKV